MLRHINRLALAATAWLIIGLDAALAQMARPATGPKMFSLQDAWNWLLAKPGVLIGLAIAVACLIFMFATRNKKSKV